MTGRGDDLAVTDSGQLRQVAAQRLLEASEGQDTPLNPNPSQQA